MNLHIFGFKDFEKDDRTSGLNHRAAPSGSEVMFYRSRAKSPDPTTSSSSSSSSSSTPESLHLSSCCAELKRHITRLMRLCHRWTLNFFLLFLFFFFPFTGSCSSQYYVGMAFAQLSTVLPYPILSCSVDQLAAVWWFAVQISSFNHRLSPQTHLLSVFYRRASHSFTVAALMSSFLASTRGCFLWESP